MSRNVQKVISTRKSPRRNDNKEDSEGEKSVEEAMVSVLIDKGRKMEIPMFEGGEIATLFNWLHSRWDSLNLGSDS